MNPKEVKLTLEERAPFMLCHKRNLRVCASGWHDYDVVIYVGQLIVAFLEGLSSITCTGRKLGNIRDLYGHTRGPNKIISPSG
jgi:hypothetical protein